MTVSCGLFDDVRTVTFKAGENKNVKAPPEAELLFFYFKKQ